MIFYVYFDPAVITLAQSEGHLALQLLISVLRGFLQNCLLVDFEDYRLQSAIREQVEAINPDFNRKLIKSILVMMSKRNRYVYCLTPDYTGSKSEQHLLMEQAAVAAIDLALLTEASSTNAAPPQMEVTTLSKYHHSDFEVRRSQIAGSGKRSSSGEMSTRDFLDRHFGKAMRFATKIELCDRAFGRHYGENYEYSVQEFLQWLESVLAKPEKCEICFHCERGTDKKNAAIERGLRGIKRGRLAALKIQVQYYEGNGSSDSLPHERFIRTQQVALSIDRGLDFLDRLSKTNRDVFITTTDLDDCESVLNRFADQRFGEPRVI